MWYLWNLFSLQVGESRITKRWGWKTIYFEGNITNSENKRQVEWKAYMLASFPFKSKSVIIPNLQNSKSCCYICQFLCPVLSRTNDATNLRTFDHIYDTRNDVWLGLFTTELTSPSIILTMRSLSNLALDMCVVRSYCAKWKSTLVLFWC